jgi:hypothetical protein
MRLKNALTEFEKHLRRAGDEQVPRTPRAGIERMMTFYREVRADDVDMDSDGDMLLFQWGTFDWGGGAMFEVDITRQLIKGEGEDDDIWQLHLTYRFAPTEALRAIGNGDHWCGRPDQAPSFEEFIAAHPAISAVGLRDDGQTRLEYECAG